MSDKRHETGASDVEENQEPVRQPTTKEKATVLLPALIAFAGMILMLAIFVILVATRN